MDRKFHLIALVLLFVLFRGYGSQKINFADKIAFDKAHGSKEQYSNWSLDGSVQLTDNDFILFDRTVKIQTCSNLCDVDLKVCPPPDGPPASPNACYCKQKVGDTYKIHIGADVNAAHSEMLLTATIPSHHKFGSISGSAVIGQLPAISRERTRVNATYQLDNEQPQYLLPEQTVLVCPQKPFTFIKICVEDKPVDSLLKVKLYNGEIRSERPCVKTHYEYDQYATNNKITFTYNDPTSFPSDHVFILTLQEKQSACIPGAKSSGSDVNTESSNSGISGGKESEFFDVFGSNTREWRIAFRGTNEIEKSIYESYTNTQHLDVEPGCKKIYSMEACSSHYRNNDVLDNWENIYQVAFLVFKGDERVAHVVFDGIGSNSDDWFNKSRILTSSWTDLQSESSNVFEIIGDVHGVFERYFFINHGFGGCLSDNGWFVVVDNSIDGCTWAKKGKFPQFLYAKKKVRTNWTHGDVGLADYIAILVKYF